MKRTTWLSSLLSISAAVAISGLPGCGTDQDEPETSSVTQAQHEAELAACHLDDGSLEKGAHLHACDPKDKKKTTICHIPPGNPANAHTLCVGNAAVPAHLKNHGDYVGACKVEKPCPPPANDGGAGGGGPTGSGGTGGTGMTGAGGTGMTGAGGTGMTGAGGTGMTGAGGTGMTGAGGTAGGAAGTGGGIIP